ncbi:ester cyclase [Sphingoaurantiacus capsulatus]|uniref:Ester cyclase n=1 Tax=Sphingoaurantiacus capsulatus TaxID=1771310 RepID=A0ABV7XBU1_9SPHN
MGELATVRAHREAVVREHMVAETELDFERVMATFTHPRYELIGTDTVFDGDAEVRRYFQLSRTPFPDQRNEIIQLHHTDDGVLAEFWLLGTHKGPISAGGQVIPPTGKSFKVRMAALFIFDGDGIACERVWFDQLSIMRQLGLAPA